jgi:hypothetical protein
MGDDLKAWDQRPYWPNATPFQTALRLAGYVVRRIAWGEPVLILPPVFLRRCARRALTDIATAFSTRPGSRRPDKQPIAGV